MRESEIQIEAAKAKARVLVSSRETRGRYAVCQIDAGPGAIPAHAHRYEDLCFYILEGKFSFVIGGSREEAVRGTSVLIPRETVYSVEGAGRLLLVAYPGGIDLLLHDVAASREKSLAPVLEKHGITGLPPMPWPPASMAE